MPKTPALAPELFFDTVWAFQRTAALRAAIDLDLFTAIDNGEATVQAIAQACAASERGTRMLCDYLTIVGFLIKEDDRYRLTAETAAFLSTRSPAYLGCMIEFLNAPDIVDNFTHLTETVRRGTVAPAQSTVSPENPVWQTFARAMMPMAMPLAEAVADILQADTGSPLRVLDIAAGHGLYGIAIARRNPRAEIVAVDWPAVLEVATGNARRFGVAARHTTLPGDAFAIDWGIGFDVALITNFLHHFDAPTCVAFLKKIHGSLNAGGRVAVVEFVPNEDRVSPPQAAAFALNMLAGTPAGDAYTFVELNDMLTLAGFSEVSRQPLPGPQTVVLGSL